MRNLIRYLKTEFEFWNRAKRDYKKSEDRTMEHWCEGRAVQALKTLRKIKLEELK